jgi:TrmH family RNA methyltransferase
MARPQREPVSKMGAPDKAHVSENRRRSGRYCFWTTIRGTSVGRSIWKTNNGWRPTTSRDRDQYFRVVDVREVAVRIVTEAERSPAAVVFGAERTGLTNEELETAHALIRIPASPVYPSLNLAMAVQLVAYEIFRAQGVTPAAAVSGAAPLASAQAMERLYVHLGAVLEEIDFRDRTQKGTHLMSRIRRFLQRAELDENEVNILRGILTAVQSKRRSAGPRL